MVIEGVKYADIINNKLFWTLLDFNPPNAFYFNILMQNLCDVTLYCFHPDALMTPLAFWGAQVRHPQRLANHIELGSNNSSVHTYTIFKVYKRITVLDN